MMKYKYESDLSRRERWKKQWATICSLKGRKRVEYLWSYYKYVLVIVLAIVLVIYTIGVMIGNAMENTVLSVVVVDSAKTDGDTAKAMEKYFLDMMGKDGKNDRVETVLSATSQEDGDNIAKLRVSLSTVGGADLVICGEKVFEEYNAQGAFADMGELLGEGAKEAEPYMTDGQLDLAKCPDSVLSEYVTYSPAYLCVLEHSERKAEAAAVAGKILEGK